MRIILVTVFILISMPVFAVNPFNPPVAPGFTISAPSLTPPIFISPPKPIDLGGFTEFQCQDIHGNPIIQNKELCN